MWAGASSPGSAPFRVDSDGTVYMNTLVTETEQGGTTTIDLERTALWKLGYATVKSLTVSGGYCTSITFSNAVSGSQTVNFKSAASFTLDGEWGSGSGYSSARFYYGMYDGATAVQTSYSSLLTFDYSAENLKTALASGTHKVNLSVQESDNYDTVLRIEVDASGAYSAGESAEWTYAYGQCYSERDGAVINTKIPSVNKDSFSTYSYTISTDYAWENPAHIRIKALINGIEVSSQSVRANQPIT